MSIRTANPVLVVVIGLLPGLWAPWATAAPALDAATVKRLKKWEVVSSSQKVDGQDVMMGRAVGTVADKPEAVLHTILDVARYKHFLPRIKDSRIVRRRGKYTYAVVESALPWPVRDAWVYVKVVHYHKGGRVYEVKWKMINGTMKQYHGRALIRPWNDDASHALVIYELMAEPKTAAPDSAISKGARRVAEIFVHRLRMRVRALRKYDKFPANLVARYKR